MDNIAKNKLYTYADYMSYSESERIEIIDGHIYAMSPAPSRIHQKLISSLVIDIGNYIKSNRGFCEIYPAPFDVFLIDTETLESCRNIVQPDISVICDKNKLTDKGCVGAPDFIIEVVSPYNPSSDYVRKLSLYEHFKVREYWIVNPLNSTILVYRLDDTMYYASPEAYTFKDKVKVGIYDNLEISFADIEL
ncbi:MAG: Uma2 family endonuclease [Bacillota bacterium]|nr:Uma2 family endonuclease [Bacillota bacterium]